MAGRGKKRWENKRKSRQDGKASIDQEEQQKTNLFLSFFLPSFPFFFSYPPEPNPLTFPPLSPDGRPQQQTDVNQLSLNSHARCAQPPLVSKIYLTVDDADGIRGGGFFSRGRRITSTHPLSCLCSIGAYLHVVGFLYVPYSNAGV